MNIIGLLNICRLYGRKKYIARGVRIYVKKIIHYKNGKINDLINILVNFDIFISL